MPKKALITGITGQDGSYLAELLLEKGYEVYGLQRRASLPNTARVDHLYEDSDASRFFMMYGDVTDGSNLTRIINKVRPDEIYNLAAQSHVAVSFEKPEYTHNVNALGPLRILEIIRNLELPARFYQASSSEMFGRALETPQNEKTPFNPQSPYGLSKLFAFHTTKIFREGYGVFASNGILFNHESPRRGLNFVTRKITLGFSRIKLGTQRVLRLGNMDAKRDWGYSKDYVELIWRILQHDKPDDFVIATGETHTVREFAEEAAKYFDMDIEWNGSGMEEKGVDRASGKTIIEIDKVHFRPTEVDVLQGDSTKAKNLLGWVPKTDFKALVRLMAEHDFEYAKREVESGHPIVTQRKFNLN